MSRVKQKITRVITVGFLFLIAAMAAGISVGSSHTGITDFFHYLFSAEPAAMTARTIFLEIRLPRVIVAAIVGAVLSLAGMVFQAILRNPLAEPYILGISGGAAVGAILGILAGWSSLFLTNLMAFAGGMTTLLLVILLARGEAILRKESLLLSGVMVNAFCSAVIMFFVSMTQDARLHTIIFWLMGDFSSATGFRAVAVFLTALPCFVIILFFSHSLNLIVLGSKTALSLGIDARRVIGLLLVVSSFMVSATVAHCGLIAFVGLVIPHLLRMVVGPDHRVLGFACIFFGAGYLVLCDLAARTIPETGEMPAGVITALVGAPLFIYLLQKRGGQRT